MSDNFPSADFDIQAAWMRRFKSDIESNLHAFALRLKEALPENVTILTQKPLFGKKKTIGVSIEMGEHKYMLKIENSKLKSSMAFIVRNIVLNTKTMDPAEWFTQLALETKKTTEHAKILSQSLSAFMTS